MNTIRKILSIKNLSWICIGIYVLCLIPLFLIGLYNYPCIDDFSSAANAHRVWESTHAIFPTLVQVVQYTGHLYMTWTGDFATTFLTILQPIIWGEKASFIVPVIMLGMLTLSFCVFSKTVLISWLQVDKYIARIITFVPLILIVERMCSGVEGLYWYTGAINYTFPYGMFLLLLACMVKLFILKNSKRPILWTVLTILCEIFMGAGNYMLSVNVLVVNAVVMLLLILNKQRKDLLIAAVNMFFFVAAFLTSVCAPGNAVRGGTTEGTFSALKSVLISFYYCLEYVFEMWVDWTFIVMVLIALPFMVLAVSKIRFKFKYPVLFVLFNYCLLSSLFTAPVFGTGNVDAGRIQNVLFMQCVLLSFCNVFYITGWFVQNVIKDSFVKEMENEGILSMKTASYVMTTIAFLGFGVLLTIVPEPNYYTTSSAMHSLITGEAAAYGAEVDQRIEALSDENILDCVVQPFEARPYLLYFSDATQNADDWESIATARYYDKNSIVVVN